MIHQMHPYSSSRHRPKSLRDMNANIEIKSIVTMYRFAWCQDLRFISAITHLCSLTDTQIHAHTHTHAHEHIYNIYTYI